MCFLWDSHEYIDKICCRTEDGAVDGGGGEDEKKRQKRGGKGMLKTKKKEDVPKLVTVSRAPRGKKKSVTVVTGLSTFGN